MVKRMLVDTNHPEETRVVVLDGTRLDEFDVETSTKKQNKGNIYLAKVIRVEPSLQAAFVDYGGNRHGFLAFSEIHPDYYQIPVADREALLAEAKEHNKSLEDDDDDQDVPDKGQTTSNEASSESGDNTKPDTPLDGGNGETTEPASDVSEPAASVADDETKDASAALPLAQAPAPKISADETPTADASEQDSQSLAQSSAPQAVETETTAPPADTSENDDGENPEAAGGENTSNGDKESSGEAADASGEDNADKKSTRGKGKPGVEELGGEDETEENLDGHRRKFVASRRYKIQEVIKRRQILLIQVVKEERGNKGAALTTYLSLAGRYCVLMPNSARGGGVSRKITNLKDRRRLKSIVSELKISEHMAVILRTAGSERSKAEIKRDYEYLQRTWNQIRELTMESRAPALIHEEANLIKRSIRDVYTRDIEEILVEGEDGYRAAKEFMKTLTPSHAKKVQRYKDDSIPLFHRYQVESQLDAMHSPTVTLKSGGSIVFGQTEALVAIDVNSGRATRERHIEETAVKTNLEAASEIARQLRLRDLAGLVVIDFIDMDENRNNHAVERRLKEALKSDRARIQVGRISHFGLLELSRQRLRPSLMETNFETCKSCAGTGMIRSTESTSIQTLRAIEEEGLRNRTAELTVSVHPDVALYILNYKREILEEIQTRHGMTVFILGDSDLIPPDMSMDRVKGDGSKRPENQSTKPAVVIEHEPDDDANDDTPQHAHDEGHDGNKDDEQEGGRKKRRRRRRKKRADGDDSGTKNTDQSANQDSNDGRPSNDSGDQGDEDGEPRKGRRRGRRGGRRRKRKNEEAGTETTSQSGSDAEHSDGNNAEAPAAAAGSSDPIPVQPSPEQPAKTASRFFSAFKKGADAILGGASESTAPPVIKSDDNLNGQTESAPTPKSEAPKPAPARTSEPKPQPKAEAKAEPKPEPATAPPPAKDPEPIVAAKPATQDLAPPAPTGPKPIEKADGPPRKGWWNN